MIRTRGEVLRIDRIVAVSRVGDDDADAGREPCREGAQEVVGRLVNEAGQLVLVCGVEEEMAEACYFIKFVCELWIEGYEKEGCRKKSWWRA